MSIETQISFDDWVATYQPQRNHLDGNAPWDGLMYETFGPEVEFIKTVASTSPDRVWTLVDADGRSVIASGWHFVNRVGYMVTAVPCPPGEFIDVIDDDDDDDDDNVEEDEVG